MKIDSQIYNYFPNLSKSMNYEGLWELCKKQGYDIDVYDKLVGEVRPLQYQLNITIYHQEKSLITSIIPDKDRHRFIDKKDDYNFEYIYKWCIDALIKNGYIKKSRKSKKPTTDKQHDSLEDLRRLRNNLSTRISTWKKLGKDTSALEAARAECVQKLKMLTK